MGCKRDYYSHWAGHFAFTFYKLSMHRNVILGSGVVVIVVPVGVVVTVPGVALVTVPVVFAGPGLVAVVFVVAGVTDTSNVHKVNLRLKKSKLN